MPGRSVTRDLALFRYLEVTGAFLPLGHQQARRYFSPFCQCSRKVVADDNDTMSHDGRGFIAVICSETVVITAVHNDGPPKLALVPLTLHPRALCPNTSQCPVAVAQGVAHTQMHASPAHVRL